MKTSDKIKLLSKYMPDFKNEWERTFKKVFYREPKAKEIWLDYLIKRYTPNLVCPKCGKIINNKDLKNLKCIKCDAKLKIEFVEKDETKLDKTETAKT